MRLLSSLPKDYLSDKTVILRAGLNLPLDAEGDILDTFRLEAVLPTIEYLAEHADKLIILAHKGRERTDSLAPIARELQHHMPELKFIQKQELSAAILKHKLIMLENLRQDPRETAKDSTIRMDLARELVDIIGDDSIFIQEAFSACHRYNASIVELPSLLESYAGPLLEKEVNELNKALKPPRPALFVLGGAKFATKEPLIRKFLKIYDKIFIGGAIANEFFKERGYEVGCSLVYNGKIPHDILYNERIILPEVVRVTDGYGHAVYMSPKALLPDMRIVDVVPPTDLLSYSAVKYILWNGPLGYYEGGYTQGTDKLLDMLAGAEAESVTGGGDTLATIGQERRNIFSYISVGGGAMLKFLQGESMPGIKVLE